MQYVEEFLSIHWDGQSPLLLGYSGGPDSKALLYALLDSGCKTLHLAHVDHGWRSESAGEASELEYEAQSLGLPFHKIRLNVPPKGNKEAVSREARLAFFHSLFQAYPFQALFLAHQAGDAAETALKRVLEGAHLPFLGGMEPISKIRGMDVWRPLLNVKKEKIHAFLKAKNLKPLIDPTNSDPAYLRARMRLEILPSLAQQFGKEISENLLLLSQRAAELKAYFDKKTEIHKPRRGPWGLFGHIADLERVEARYLVQKWADLENVRFTRASLETTVDAVFSNLPNRQIAPRIFIDRGSVFFLSEVTPAWGASPMQLEPGTWNWGDWTIEVALDEDQTGAESDWKDVWSGRFTACVPRGSLSMPRAGTNLRYLWNTRKVPAFLRYRVPIITNELGEVKEFLTGKILPHIRPSLKVVVSTRSSPAS